MFRLSDNFEPMYIRRMRRNYQVLTYFACFVYFIYIVYSVMTAPTVLSEDVDSSYTTAPIPNLYFDYRTADPDYETDLTIDCVYDTYTWVPGCQPWLQKDTTGKHEYIFKADPETIYFGNGENGLGNIMFLMNFTASPVENNASLGHYRGDYIIVDIADPNYDLFSNSPKDQTDVENLYYMQNENAVTLNPNEFVYVIYSRTMLNTINLAYDWLNRFGISKSSPDDMKITLNILWESHTKPHYKPTSVIELFPSTFIVMKQKQTYTLTFISAIGSLTTLIGVFAAGGAFLFGSDKLQILGYLHRRYEPQYQQLIYGNNKYVNMTFEEAVESLNRATKNSIYPIPYGYSGPELQIQMLSVWPKDA